MKRKFIYMIPMLLLSLLFSACSSSLRTLDESTYISATDKYSSGYGIEYDKTITTIENQNSTVEEYHDAYIYNDNHVISTLSSTMSRTVNGVLSYELNRYYYRGVLYLHSYSVGASENKVKYTTTYDGYYVSNSKYSFDNLVSYFDIEDVSDFLIEAYGDNFAKVTFNAAPPSYITSTTPISYEFILDDTNHFKKITYSYEELTLNTTVVIEISKYGTYVDVISLLPTDFSTYAVG